MTLKKQVSEEAVNESFNHILAQISELKEIPSLYEGADDLELNVKLLQDKVRDRYFRKDAKRERQRKRRSSCWDGKDEGESEDY